MHSSAVPALFAALTAFAAHADTLVYIGTYTNSGKSQGIYVFRFDETKGNLTPIGLAAEITSPSYIQFHPSGRYVYAVSETGTYQGERSGSLTSFSVDSKTGKLTQLNQISSKGTSPCHLSVDKTGKTLLNANYSSGNVVACPIKADGSLGEVSSNIQHQGTGPNEKRQRGPHAHSINISADNRFAIAADLGTDQMYVYKLDAADSKLTPNDPPSVKLNPGAGPRHFAFHPSGKFAFSINELQSTITGFTWNGQSGVLKEIQTITTLPNEFTRESYTAEVVVHPSGRFVYGSNRGHDSIAVFRMDANSGKLTPIEQVPTQGKTPRNFNIDPSGKWLIAANQDSDSLVVFQIDGKSGRLTPTGQTLEVGAPVCVKFLRVNP